MNILAIGAHFDDVELGCGGALYKHAQKGDKVYIYVATNSGFTNYLQKVIRDSNKALEEGKAAAEILGAELICGDFETLNLKFCDELNTDLLKIIESKKIDQIYTHWAGDVHHDHTALAQASMHAGRHVKKVLLYRSNWYHSNQAFKNNFYIDISKEWQYKAEAIKAHKSEYDRVGKKWIEFFKNEAENAGQRIGCQYAESFEILKWYEE